MMILKAIIIRKGLGYDTQKTIKTVEASEAEGQEKKVTQRVKDAAEKKDRKIASVLGSILDNMFVNVESV